MIHEFIRILRVAVRRKYESHRSRPHLIDHIFGGKNNSYSIIFKTVLQSGALKTPSEDRLTKNEKMTIALAKDMARSTTDLSDELLERWLELRRCFSA